MKRREPSLRGYRALIAWQRAMDFACDGLDLCDAIPVRAGAGVVSQLRRSLVSVPSNIAEGYGRPSSEQSVYLRHARGSLWEAATQLEILDRRGRVRGETLIALLESADEIGRVLHGYMRHIESGRGPSSRSNP